MNKEDFDDQSVSRKASTTKQTLQAPELESILNSTNTTIWTIDTNYCLTYGNKQYFDEYYESFNRNIEIGDDIIFPEFDDQLKREWKEYYDRALNGEYFSIDRKRQFCKDNKWSAYYFGPLIDKLGKITGASIVAHDITDRVKTKTALKKSDERFKDFVEMLPEAIFEMNENLKIVYGNRKAFELFGYNEDDIETGLFALEMLAPEERKRASENFINRYNNIDPGTLEYVAIKKDGTKFPVLFHANTIIENNVVKGARGIIIDISERKKNDAQQKQMALMLDLAPSTIIIHDFEGNILFANKKTFDLYGYSREEFMSLTLKSINSIDSAKNITPRMNIIRVKGEARLQVKHIKKDGSEIHLEVYSLITKYNGNQAILSVGTDITKHKQDEKILRDSEEKFKNIFNNSVVGISVTSLDGKLKVNKSFSQIIGYSEEELNNNIWQSFTHPDDIEKNEEILKSILKGDIETARWEKRYIHKNGNTIWVDISTAIQKDANEKPQYFITSIIDITERKQADEELKSKNAFIEKLIDNSAVSTWISDKNGTVIKMNQACLDFIGATEDEIIGKYNIFNDNVIKENGLMPEIEKVFKNGEVGSFTFDYNLSKVNHVKASFDKHIIVNSILTPILDDNGVVTNVIVQAIDLSEIKKKEDELKSNEAFLTDTQKIANLGTYSMDIISGFWESSEILDKIFGIDKNFSKDIEGWLSLIHPEWHDIMHDHLITDVLGKKGNFDKEYKIIRFNDREERWLHGLGKLEFDESGQPVRMIGTIQDITEMKRIQEELTDAKTHAEETEKQLLAILENSPTGFAISLISTGMSRYVNKAFREIYQLPDDMSVYVKDFIDYVYADRKDIGERIIADVMSGDPERMRWEMIPITNKKTKKTYYVSAANIILKDLDLMISTARDVTSRVENEQKLIEAFNKATESDRLKSAFLANMSHEIRTPMNGILGFASLLKEPQLTGAEQKKYIDIIEKSGERMLNTINDIIDISKIEAGQMEVSNSEFNITELFDNILSFFKPEADKKGIYLTVDHKMNDEQIIIKSDKEKINAVIINLVKNAIKFSDHGFIEFGCIRKNNFLEIYVKDTGRGIPANRISAIFERFVQADIDDKEAKEGSGLGLSIAKSYVELLGGKIWVESEKDVGTTFYFTIPYLKSEAETKIENSNNFILDKNIRLLNILIVEDDQVSELLTKVMVEKISNKIFIARTGIEAIDLFKNNPEIDLILMDIKLPVMNGYDATKKIRRLNKNVKIIATTAFALTGDKEKAIEAGCNDYLAKPLSQKDLDEVLALYFQS